MTGSGDLARIRLLGRGDVPADAPTAVGADEVRIELAAELFGERRALPPGSYRVVVGTDNVSLSADLRGRLPEVQLGERHRARFHLGPRGGLVLDLGAAAHRRRGRPLRPAATPGGVRRHRSSRRPGPLLLRELRGPDRHRQPARDLRGAAPAGGPPCAHCGASPTPLRGVPDGATPVLLRSRGWYDALATAGVLVLNTDIEVWFRRRPGQFLLQTFHGYPSKAMGRSQWEAKDFPPCRVREFRARGVDTWSAILTPTPEMTRHYREQYDYAGPAFEHGYPRDDGLTGPEAAAVAASPHAPCSASATTRRRCSTPRPGATTWRPGPRAAAMADHLDSRQAADALGARLRAAAARPPVPRPAAGRGAARIVDVTSYPEINDLILAADVAVLDYSSLRFDFALTGKPMVFLVPDLADYGAGTRRFLFPFEDSAPGPFVEDTAEVVEQLRDRRRSPQRWAQPIAGVQRDLQPVAGRPRRRAGRRRTAGTARATALSGRRLPAR